MEILRRVGTALFFGPVVIGIVLSSNRFVFFTFVAVVSFICILEISYNILKMDVVEKVFLILMTITYFLIYMFFDLSLSLVATASLFMLYLSFALFHGNDRWLKGSHIIFSFFYVVIPLSILIPLWENFGKKPVVFFFLIIWVCDAGAYIFGTWCGKRPLFPRVSPKKTVEGLIGGVLSSVVIASAFGSFFLETSREKIILVSLFILAPAIFGDLVESLMKRWADVKDSSSLLPGHGGLLDRFDSTIFSVPFYYLALKIIGL